MLRDLFMALMGACSTVIVIAIIVAALKRREREGYKRAHSESYEEHFRRTELSSNDEFD